MTSGSPPLDGYLPDTNNSDAMTDIVKQVKNVSRPKCFTFTVYSILYMIIASLGDKYVGRISDPVPVIARICIVHARGLAN